MQSGFSVVGATDAWAYRLPFRKREFPRLKRYETAFGKLV
jgi:hypothetical protein